MLSKVDRFSLPLVSLSLLLSAVITAGCGGGKAFEAVVTDSGSVTRTNASPPVPAPAPTSLAPAALTPAASPALAEWTFCANENGTCTFSGTQQVRYGLNGIYVYGTFTGSVACKNDVFVDPLPGVDKKCDVAATATAAATSAPAPATSTGTAPTVTPTATGGQYLFFGDAELATVRSRIANGPFKSDNDAWSGSPGDWNRIIRFADQAVSQGLDDGYDPMFWYVGQRAVAAAFAWLVTGKTNSSYFNAARAQLLTLVTDPKFDVRKHTGDSHSIPYTKMMPRVAVAYDILKSNLSATDIATIESNLVAWGNYLKALHDVRHASVMSQVAGSVQWYGGDPSTYAFKDATGTTQVRIPNVALYMSNLPSLNYLSMGLLGVVTNNQTLIDAGKIYFDDWMKYAVHPSGVQGDYTRNGDYGIHAQGRIYSSLNTQMGILFAEALRRKRNDGSQYTYSTSGGAFGWEGGSKSLSLVIETHLDLLARRKNYYSAVDSSAPSEATHLGVINVPSAGYSYHDLGFMMARQALPAISQKIQDVARRNRSVYPQLEAFPTSTPDTGSGYGYGFGWTDVAQAMPAIWILYGQP